jgi:hypothetical protein
VLSPPVAVPMTAGAPVPHRAAICWQHETLWRGVVTGRIVRLASRDATLRVA